MPFGREGLVKLWKSKMDGGRKTFFNGLPFRSWLKLGFASIETEQKVLALPWTERCHLPLTPFELELAKLFIIQKPKFRGEVDARALRVKPDCGWVVQDTPEASICAFFDPPPRWGEFYHPPTT